MTPEFQKYIAKHLTTILDKKLNKMSTLINSNEELPEKHNEGGVKLLSNSVNFVDIECQLNENINSYRKRKKSTKTPYIKKENLKNLAVSAEAILAKEDIKFWSTRTKGKIFHYLKDDTGQFLLKE